MGRYTKIGMDIVRTLFFAIDAAIYRIIVIMYNLMSELAGVSFLGAETMDAFAARIYLFVGIFVLFRMAFALINNFINPDSFYDSKTGGGQILKRLMIALVLLVFTPTIFQMAFRLQYIVLQQNVIGAVIMGSSHNQAAFADAGNAVSVTIFEGFFYPATDGDGNLICSITGDRQFKSVASAYEVLYSTNSSGAPGFRSYQYCYHYSFFLSTVAGGFAAWIMLIFAIDIAVRAAKLAVLQLIAPLPIISYVDPKKGEKIFNNWVSESVSTYLDLFMRLIALFTGVFLITQISSFGFFQYDEFGNLTDGSDLSAFVKMVAVIGILLFANRLPDLIYGIFGIKKPEGFTLNPIKKVRDGMPKPVKSLGNRLGAAGLSAAAHHIRQKTEIGELDKKKDALKIRELENSKGRNMALGAFRGFSNGADGILRGTERANDIRNKRTNPINKKTYSYQMELMDKATDVLGIKTDEGTSEMLKTEKIKKSALKSAKQTEYEQLSRLIREKTPSQFQTDISGVISNDVTEYYDKDGKPVIGIKPVSDDELNALKTDIANKIETKFRAQKTVATDELSSYQNKYSTKKQEVSKVEKEISDLRTAGLESTRRYEAIKDEIAKEKELLQKIDPSARPEKQKIIDELNKKSGELRSEMEQLKTEITDKTDDRKELKQQLFSLEEKAAESNRMLNTVKAEEEREIETLKSQIDSLAQTQRKMSDTYKESRELAAQIVKIEKVQSLAKSKGKDS